MNIHLDPTCTFSSFSNLLNLRNSSLVHADSTVVASVLQRLNEQHAYGVQLVLVAVDEGIRGYRDDSLAALHRFAALIALPLRIVSFKVSHCIVLRAIHVCHKGRIDVLEGLCILIY